MPLPPLLKIAIAPGKLGNSFIIGKPVGRTANGKHPANLSITHISRTDIDTDLDAGQA